MCFRFSKYQEEFHFRYSYFHSTCNYWYSIEHISGFVISQNFNFPPSKMIIMSDRVACFCHCLFFLLKINEQQISWMWQSPLGHIERQTKLLCYWSGNPFKAATDHRHFYSAEQLIWSQQEHRRYWTSQLLSCYQCYLSLNVNLDWTEKNSDHLIILIYYMECKRKNQRTESVETDYEVAFNHSLQNMRHCKFILSYRLVHIGCGNIVQQILTSIKMNWRDVQKGEPSLKFAFKKATSSRFITKSVQRKSQPSAFEKRWQSEWRIMGNLHKELFSISVILERQTAKLFLQVNRSQWIETYSIHWILSVVHK